VTTEDGIVYTLRFGEVLFATGEALTAGTEEEAKSQAAAEGKTKPEGAQENRFLMVSAEFDPSLLPPPPKPPGAPADSELPAEVFQQTPKEKADKEKADKEKYEREKADYDRKVEDGKKRAAELTDRFVAWYYVVPGDAFRSVVLDRNALIRKKDDKPAGGDIPPPLFPGQGGGALPPGLRGLPGARP
jgi:hypothetical protein